MCCSCGGNLGPEVRPDDPERHRQRYAHDTWQLLYSSPLSFVTACYCLPLYSLRSLPLITVLLLLPRYCPLLLYCPSPLPLLYCPSPFLCCTVPPPFLCCTAPLPSFVLTPPHPSLSYQPPRKATRNVQKTKVRSLQCCINKVDALLTTQRGPVGSSG